MIYLIRHGETYWNNELRFQGHTDIALNEIGLKQAELLGKYLSKMDIKAVYSSDLIRAKATAEAVACCHGTEVKTDSRLREIFFGDWEGLTYLEIKEKWSTEIETFFNTPNKISTPNGESFGDVLYRSKRAFEDILGQHKDENIAIVAHGGTIRTLLCDIIGLDLNNMWRLKQDNTAVNLINCRGDYKVLEYLNATYHLPMELKTSFNSIGNIKEE